MLLQYFALAYGAALAVGSPVPDPEPQLSLPPLIPSIPDPFTGSNIKPKKIGYFWTGAGDNEHADFLVTYSLDDDTFGEFIWLTDVPSSGNSPHHLGGLLSLLKTQDTAYYFDVSNPYRPTFLHSDRAILSSITDEIRAKPDGGFLITYMGSAVGPSPGRLVETDANYDIILEFSAVTDVAGTLNVVEDLFNPHGLIVDWDKNIILTSDFVAPLSILKPSLGIQHDNTLRLWNLDSRIIISTITIPNGGGIQDVKFIPGNNESAALATAVALGQDLGPSVQNVIAIYSDITQHGNFAYFTLTTANHIAALDIRDLTTITPDQKHIVVTDYFVQTGDIGLINTPADFRALYIDINADGSLYFNRSIDFEQQFSRGGKPHSSVVFDLTDPAHPIYY
ncbi:hypothetical protein NA56DRAFT_676756 [Hyaloscypha hepaticicola]|uniref:Methanethiol oxidase n=1 Tax=Hyaloscypha hepaticicola TaxID=2082293 RepID=A0A2J6QJF1_9HELO|nr:hypothetical protein NA56DRAFT_676756 [Hyaloscypha hepaticicola]